ncbi:hypothetical protein QN372_10800 [Undibacterium sp. RTI2.1]|uniref:hypothetical protein n=1 Tax=unclassified Undibacterium TaxID=2630295 RepID=UPI002AB400AA|nr:MULTISPECIES: hypothetical protein [unclassified Undibacterium]MDY7537376.1 hypothetical protein [Undibacterium sp. 5I1]MEB0031237.1 hypothetical protein [Undibacterium sp. RTI2.1]MEB0117617.1 hypothetical protein [Undibacterium sp. RTI2.2]MEB0232025.1 hypothetical protein [Undibacterium sp. 10I3]MEB0259306.1 hypothetical protein [Undibacterium sp. 5I1]
MWSLFLIQKNQKTKSMGLFVKGSQEFFYNIFDLIIQITSASKQLCSGAGWLSLTRTYTAGSKSYG